MFKFELHLHHLHLQMKHWLFDREKKYFGEILWKSSDRLLSFKKAGKCFWGRRMPCIRLLGIREKIQIALDLFRVGWTYVLLPFAMIRALDRVIRVRNIWNLFKATARNIDLLTYVLLQPAAILNDTGTLMRTYSKPLQGILISISCQVLVSKFTWMLILCVFKCPRMAFVHIIF